MSTSPTAEQLQELREELIASGELSALVDSLDNWQSHDTLAYCSIRLDPRQLQAWADFAIELSRTHANIEIGDRTYGSISALRSRKDREDTAVRNEFRRRHEET